MAVRTLGDYIRAELFEDFGVCQSCYRHAENQARIGRLHDLKVEREYQNVRKASSRSWIDAIRYAMMDDVLRG